MTGVCVRLCMSGAYTTAFCYVIALHLGIDWHLSDAGIITDPWTDLAPFRYQHDLTVCSSPMSEEDEA